MISNRLIRVPITFTRRTIRQFTPTSNTARHQDLHRVTRSNRQTKKTATSRRAPIRNNRFLHFVSRSIPMNPFTINHNPLHNRLDIIPIRLIRRRLAKSSTSARANHNRHIFNVLLFNNAAYINNKLTNRHLKVKTRRVRHFIRRQGVKANRQKTFKANGYHSIIINRPADRELRAFKVNRRLVSRP